ncbi:unnamed protein product [Peniophora sp. CBMAI 1063]|nr:unnamed protein product [Peniophora sp. CBMAI 1063]
MDSMAGALGFPRRPAFDPNATPRAKKTKSNTNTGEEDDADDGGSPGPGGSPRPGGSGNKGKERERPSDQSRGGPPLPNVQMKSNVTAEEMERLADFFKSYSASPGEFVEIPPDILDILARLAPSSSGSSAPASDPFTADDFLSRLLMHFRTEVNRAASRAANLAANRVSRINSDRLAEIAREAAKAAAQEVRDQVKESIKAGVAEAMGAQQGRRGARSSQPVDPTKAPPRSVKHRDVEANKLQKAIRTRISELWAGKGIFGPPVREEFATPVRDYYRVTLITDPYLKDHFRFPNLDMLGDAFTIADFAVVTSTGPKSDGGWNLFMMQYFANDFVKIHEQYSRADVEGAFATWLTGLRNKRLKRGRQVEEEAVSNATLLDIIARDNSEHAQTETRRTVSFSFVRSHPPCVLKHEKLYFRRLGAAGRVPQAADPERLLENLVIALDFDGMSDNHVVIDGDNIKTRLIRRPIWRAPFIRKFLSFLDYIARGLRLDAPDKRGAEPAVRRMPPPDSPQVHKKSRVRKGLWRNIYDQDWINGQAPEYIQHHVAPLETDFPTQFPAELTESVLSHTT